MWVLCVYCFNKLLLLYRFENWHSFSEPIECECFENIFGTRKGEVFITWTVYIFITIIIIMSVHILLQIKKSIFTTIKKFFLLQIDLVWLSLAYVLMGIVTSDLVSSALLEGMWLCCHQQQVSQRQQQVSWEEKTLSLLIWLHAYVIQKHNVLQVKCKAETYFDPSLHIKFCWEL